MWSFGAEATVGPSQARKHSCYRDSYLKKRKMSWMQGSEWAQIRINGRKKGGSVGKVVVKWALKFIILTFPLYIEPQELNKATRISMWLASQIQ